jgi:TatD DNase family protein
MQDIHTHLSGKAYDADRDAVLARAHAAGVEMFFTVGCTIEESRQSVALAEKYSEIYASVGIHPNEVNQEWGIKNGEWLKELRILAQQPKVVAIGECGLDYYRRDGQQAVTDEEKQLQRNVFLVQLGLAHELNLPVIVHCRDAYEDMYEILRGHDSQFMIQDSCFILHCYMGDTEVTKAFLTLPNVYFSFTGNITYPVKKALVGTKDDLSETVKLIPLDRMFVETDCPFLAPQSHRGKQNEPAYVVETLARVAELRGATAVEMERLMTENFLRVFPRPHIK